MKRTRGKYHADVEPVTAEDTFKMMSCFPKNKSFKEAIFRPVIVEIGLEKIAIRKSIEDRIHADIRNGKELVKKDLDAIFALSLVITTLEELLK